MKNNSTAFSLVFIFLFITNCSSQNLAPETWQRKWMLIAFEDFSRDLMVKNNAYLDLSPTKSPENQFSANMGCNGMFLTAEFKNNGTVKFSNVGSTMMYCEKNMDLETEFGRALPKITKFKIEGHFLFLSDENGNEMKFIAEDWD